MVRVRVPFSPQIPIKPPQVDQGPAVTEPHEVPVVLRVHGSVSVVVTEPHIDALQVGVVMVRDREPVSVQVLS